MAGCAFGPCGRDNETYAQVGLVFHGGRFVCYLCYVLPVKFAPVVRCPNTVKATGTQCELVKGHPPAVHCRPGREAKTEQALREGDPRLAAERKRNPTFTKRQRAGPNWVPPARRV